MHYIYRYIYIYLCIYNNKEYSTAPTTVPQFFTAIAALQTPPCPSLSLCNPLMLLQFNNPLTLSLSLSDFSAEFMSSFFSSEQFLLLCLKPVCLSSHDDKTTTLHCTVSKYSLPLSLSPQQCNRMNVMSSISSPPMLQFSHVPSTAPIPATCHRNSFLRPSSFAPENPLLFVTHCPFCVH